MPKKSFTSIVCLSLLISALLWCTGCASYDWSRAELPFKKLYVEPASNQSFAPQIQAPLSAQLRQALIRDGRVQIIDNPKEADAILQVNVTQYNRNASTRDSQDSEIARGFDINMRAQIALYDAANKTYFFRDRNLSVKTNAFTNDPNSGEVTFALAEHQAMPRLANDLARKIANEVLSVW